MPLSSAANLIMSGFSEIYESSIGLRKFFLVFFSPENSSSGRKKSKFSAEELDQALIFFVEIPNAFFQ